MISYHANPNPKTPLEMPPDEFRIYIRNLHIMQQKEQQELLQRYRANQKWFDSFNDARVPAFG